MPFALLPRMAAAIACVAVAGCDASAPGSAGSSRKANVLVILVDDLGYSDLGAFGSEIATPNIDAIARDGRVLTNFHTTPLCATSRAELMTGVDHHRVGVGTLSESAVFYPGQDNYKGDLNDNAPTVAQLLGDAGYHTYMAGKWHLGGDGPKSVGFEQSFSLDYAAAFASNYKPSAARSRIRGQALLRERRRGDAARRLFLDRLFHRAS
jgi:arylsulfatase A-like enzyme